MAEPGRSHATGIRYLLQIAGIALAYVAAARLGLSLAFVTRQVTAVWPPTGIALAALLLLGTRAWPGVALGAFVINAVTDEPLPVAVGIAFGNTLEAVVGAAIVRRLVVAREATELVRGAGAIVAAAAGSTVISASIGTVTLCLGGIVRWQSFGSVWWLWWLGDAMGDLVVGSFLLAWSSPRPFGTRGREFSERIALVVLLGVTGTIALLGRPSEHHLEYIVFPFAIWTALRLGPRETSTVSALVSTMALWGAVHGRGPFAAGTLHARIMFLQTFMGTFSVTGLFLAAVTAEHRRSAEALVRAHDGLETRVRDRTSALAHANSALQSEQQRLQGANAALSDRTRELAEKNDEVEAFAYIVSHDLRAPLVNLQGFASELERSCHELTAVVHDAGLARDTLERLDPILGDSIPTSLRFIAASTTKFQRLIDALLRLSRIGHHEYCVDEVDVDAIARTTLDSLRQSIDSSRVRVKVTPLPSAAGDATAIGQILSNLIGNALNYLDPERDGVIEVSGAVEGTMAHYCVRDNGVGIPRSAQHRLFQVFQRFHPTRAPGEGMGLAIVKRIVERHRGAVWAESEDGMGTTFHVTLPRATAVPPALVVARDEGRGARAEHSQEERV